MASPWRGPTDERNNYRSVCFADECRQGRRECPEPAECCTDIGADCPRRACDQVLVGAAIFLSAVIVVAALLGVFA